MKRNQLIQIAILAVALIAAYKFIETMSTVLVGLLYAAGGNDFVKIIFTYLFISAIYGAAVVVLVRFNRQIADYIDRQGNSTPASEELIHIRVEQAHLLYIILVALCLITLINEIPLLVLDIYNYFKKEASGRFGSDGDVNFKASAIKFVFAIIILFVAKPISGWFSGQFHSNKPVAETTTGETTDLTEQS